MLEEIKEVTWFSKNTTFEKKGKNVGDCFINKHIDCKHPYSLEHSDDLLEFFQKQKSRLW